MDNFQEVIKEDIKELISEQPCFFCNKEIPFKNLGGIKHTLDNILDLENPVCIPCWNTKETVSDLFISLDDILESSVGGLTEEVKLITIEPDKGQTIETTREITSEQLFKDGCPHEYKMVGNNKVECRHCYKRYKLTAE